MAYDQELAERVRDVLAAEAGLTEQAMFGGLAFLIDGKMCVGVSGAELMIRVPPDTTDAALAEPGVRPMDMTGRPMKGWLVVGDVGIAADDDLAAWVDRSREHVRTLPAKKKPKRK